MIMLQFPTAVMVNVSDITAMGGKASVIVDTIWTEDNAQAVPLLSGMKAAYLAFNVPIVVGYTNFHSAYNVQTCCFQGRSVVDFSPLLSKLMLKLENNLLRLLIPKSLRYWRFKTNLLCC